MLLWFQRGGKKFLRDGASAEALISALIPMILNAKRRFSWRGPAKNRPLFHIRAELKLLQIDFVNFLLVFFLWVKMPQPARAVSFVLLVFHVTGFTAINGGSDRSEPEPCPSGCSCAGFLADCSGLKHGRIVERLPARITRLWVFYLRSFLCVSLTGTRSKHQQNIHFHRFCCS